MAYKVQNGRLLKQITVSSIEGPKLSWIDVGEATEPNRYFQDRLTRMVRKAQHGCTDSICPICDVDKPD